MKKSIFVSLGTVLVLAGSMPVVAQAPAVVPHVFYPPIVIVERDNNNFASEPSGLTPFQMKSAYGYNRIPNQGQNMIIGIADACDDPNLEADLGVFSTEFNLPACTTQNGCFTKIEQDNLCSGHQGNWALEQSLDVEWAHAMAPAAKIVIVQSTDTGDSLFMAVTQAVSAGAQVVSMSWAGGEFDGEQMFDQMFFSTPGVTYFSSAGDGGCGALYPAASPNVISVGGTFC